MAAQHRVPGHAFLSYVHEDASPADRLKGVLETAGITVWSDTSGLQPGMDWRIEVKRAIMTDSLAFIACFSEHTGIRKTSYQNEELILAVEQMRLRPPGTQWLIPVRFADCEIPHFDLGAGRTLHSLHHVDLFGDGWEHGSIQLVATVLRLLGSAQDADGLSSGAGRQAMRAASRQVDGQARSAGPPTPASALMRARAELKHQIDAGLLLAAAPITQLDQILASPASEAEWGSAHRGVTGSTELAALSQKVARWRQGNQTWLDRHVGHEAAEEFRMASQHKDPGRDDPAAELLFLRGDLESEIAALRSIHHRLHLWVPD